MAKGKRAKIRWRNMADVLTSLLLAFPCHCATMLMTIGQRCCGNGKEASLPCAKDCRSFSAGC
ncbi:MAG: hypothetical protein OGMRLDGQ_001960, partial [Candidatus Fervidibacter sp.]